MRARAGKYLRVDGAPPAVANGNRPIRIDFRACGARAAIVFLHGFGGDVRATWGDFPRFLMEDRRLAEWDVFSLGYPTSLRPDLRFLWAADPDIGALGLELVTTFSHPPFSAYDSLAIVAHSMGGLVAQRALLHSAAAARVGHLVMFGTPSAGLIKAYLGYLLKRQPRDMARGSSFICELRAEWDRQFANGTPFRLRAVAGDRDEFVGVTSSLNPFPEGVRLVVPGNHLEIVKPVSSDSLSVHVVAELLLPRPPVRGAVDSARLAVEERQFARAIEALLPRVENLDEAALVQLALALDGVGRGREALEILERRYHGGTTWTDALGVLGGRVKRRWLAERDEGDWARARALYIDGLTRAEAVSDADQAMYHAINIAFLDLMASPPDSAVPDTVSNMARRALQHSAGARQGHWRLATEAEAHAILGELDNACALYEQAIASRPGPRAIDSIFTQALRVVGRVFGDDARARLEYQFAAKSGVSRPATADGDPSSR